MLTGEKPHRAMLAVVVGVLLAIVVGGALWSADHREFLRPADEPTPLATQSSLDITDERVDAIEEEQANAASAMLYLQAENKAIKGALAVLVDHIAAAQFSAQQAAGEVAALKAQIAKATPPPVRSRRRATDPPAMTYLRLQ